MPIFRLLILFILLSQLLKAIDPIQVNYKSDLISMRNAFELQYPSLYRFNSKDFVDNLFEDCINNINLQTSEVEFYRIVKYILSQLKDGHLGCSAPTELSNKINMKYKHFPIKLYFINDEAYIDCDKNQLPQGSKVIEINDELIAKIKNRIFEYIVSDGKIETKKYWILSHSFWFYYSLVFGNKPEHKIRYVEPSGKERTIVVASIEKSKIECYDEDNEDNKYKLEIDERNIAILTISSFSDDNSNIEFPTFPKFLSSSFAKIKEQKIDKLIIDLRGNGGGRDIYGSLLYSYLTDKDFRYYESLETVEKLLDTIEHNNLCLQYPSEPNYMGKLVILIDGQSFSATSEFCTIAKDKKRAIFVGQETGGTYCGNTSGKFFYVTLPYSKLTINMPSTKYTMVTLNKKNTDRGIYPDYEVQPKYKDIMNGIDVQLEYAKSLFE